MFKHCEKKYMFKQERKLLTLYPPTLNPKVKGYGDLFFFSL